MFQNLIRGSFFYKIKLINLMVTDRILDWAYLSTLKFMNFFIIIIFYTIK